MFCHASTKQKNVISHLMQTPSYPGSFILPKNHKTVKQPQFAQCSAQWDSLSSLRSLHLNFAVSLLNSWFPFVILTWHIQGLLQKCNTSCFIILAHNIRGGYWWYGNRGWTSPPIFLYILLLCDRWQQWGNLIKWHLTWKCVWSKCVELDSSMQKKWCSLVFIKACCTLLEAKQNVSTVTVGYLHRCRIFIANGGVYFGK